MAKGRKTGGKPKGYKAPQTLEKLEAREFVRQAVTNALAPMLRAQIANAMGIGHIFTRDKAGKYTKIEDEDEIDRLMVEGVEGETHWIFKKDPSVQAFADLLNRAIDRPKEQEQDINIRGSIDVISILKQRHDRHRGGE